MEELGNFAKRHEGALWFIGGLCFIVVAMIVFAFQYQIGLNLASAVPCDWCGDGGGGGGAFPTPTPSPTPTPTEPSSDGSCPPGFHASVATENPGGGGGGGSTCVADSTPAPAPTGFVCPDGFHASDLCDWCGDGSGGSACIADGDIELTYFSGTPITVNHGETVGVAWNSFGAVECHHVAGLFDTGGLVSGTAVSNPIDAYAAEATGYKVGFAIACSGDTGTAVANFEISVNPPGTEPEATPEPAPTAVKPGSLYLRIGYRGDTPKRFKVFWSDYANNEAGYQIWRSRDKTNWVLRGTTGPSPAMPYNDFGAKIGKRYHYRVRAINVDGTFSAYSNIASKVFR